MKLHNLVPTLLLLAGTAVQASEAPASSESVARGEYLARLGDCAACHTSDPQQPFAGGLALGSPLGAMYSTNISSDPQTGIGQYSLEDFDKAVRRGVARDGRYLYPAMPYPSFAKISDQDIADLYNYFMQVKPISQANREADISWPLNMRWPLAIWNALFTEQQPYQDDPQQSAEWNRGAYLSQGLGHCGTCHTPRGIAFQERALDQNEEHYLAGGALEGWHAPDLSGVTATSLQGWSAQELISFLKVGHNERYAAFGPMAEAVQNSTQYFSDSDLQALATYLKSLSDGKPLLTAQRDATSQPLADGKPESSGAMLYLDNCAACHRSDGQGYARTFPRLAGNSALLSEDPSSLISIILKGSRMPVTHGAPTGLGMPDFGWRLDDTQVAQLATFLRSAWGYSSQPVSAEQVAALRTP